MRDDLRRALLRAAEAALHEAEQQPQPRRRARLTTGRAVLLGAGLMTTGRLLSSSRGRGLVSSVSERLSNGVGSLTGSEEDDEELYDEEEAEPEAEAEDDVEAGADEEPEGEPEDEAGEEPEEEPEDEAGEEPEDDEESEAEPEARPRRRRAASGSRGRRRS